MLNIHRLQAVNQLIHRSIIKRNCLKTSFKEMGVHVKEIVKTLQSFAPLTLAENWDNVGLLVDPMYDNKIDTVLLTNDLTEDVVDEAKKRDAKLIITYHPNIFQGLKTVSANTWKERIVVRCIKNDISVFSPHTSWDSVEGGVNDWLAKAFQFRVIKPIKERVENPLQGSGRLLVLESSINLQTAVDQIKKHIGLPHVRLGVGRHKGMDSMITSVALCAGSGSSVLKGVEADLYLTGEMSHHDVLDATQNGIHVVLCEHSNSERGFLRLFQKQLTEMFKGDSLNVVISEVDRDPLNVV